MLAAHISLSAGGDRNYVDAGAGDDDVTLSSYGPSTVYAGDGVDQVTGGPGNDEIHGGDDVDYLTGCGGRDVIKGDDGSDQIASAALFGSSCRAYDSPYGSLLCGGAGDDVLYGIGPAHQCMDPGVDQTGAAVDCFYAFDAGTRWQTTAFDVATGRNCAYPNGTFDEASCGCD